MKFYGVRDTNGIAHVYVEENGETKPLDPRWDLVNHSPSGLEYGYGGSGPAQLALGILAAVLPDEEALRLYQDFKWEVVGRMPRQINWETEQARGLALSQFLGEDVLEWELSRKDVLAWVKTKGLE